MFPRTSLPELIAYASSLSSFWGLLLGWSLPGELQPSPQNVWRRLRPLSRRSVPCCVRFMRLGATLERRLPLFALLWTNSAECSHGDISWGILPQIRWWKLLFGQLDVDVVLLALGVLLEVAHEDADRFLISAEKDRIVADVLFR